MKPSQVRSTKRGRRRALLTTLSDILDDQNDSVVGTNDAFAAVPECDEKRAP